jgi:tRNA A-37 threonylcarbamoyl transferase component Bud32
MSPTPASNQCLKCGSVIPPGSALDACPSCLLEAAVDAPVLQESYSARERKFGDYILDRQIGSGGMGIVYEAIQVSLNRRVALKFIRDSQIASPAVLRRFMIEAEAVARLRHPNIVHIHETGESDGQPFFSMDLIEGQSLKEQIAKQRFALRKDDSSKSRARNQQVKIAKLMAKMARAVHHAHQRGVLHRDLKPANILVDEAGEPHLTDFGLAKILRSDAAKSGGTTLTGPGEIAGTVGYMSPEQVSSAPVTPCSDVYGLGAILYELLTGGPPFRGGTTLEILRQVEDQQPKPPRACNPLADKDLSTICMKCLEKSPRFRYASADELAQDLENWIARKPIKARRAGPTRRTVQWVQRNPLGALLIGVLLLGLSAALFVVGVLRDRKAELELQDAEKLETIISEIAKDWRDPNTTELTIDSKQLSMLAHRPPVYDPVGQRLVYGMTIYGDAVYFAQAMADVVPDWEERMSKALGRSIYIDARFFKPSAGSAVELLEGGKADFMETDPSSFLHARNSSSEIELLAVEDNSLTGVLAARTGLGIETIRDARGRRVMFSAPYDSLTLHAKAILYDAGVTARDMARVTHLSGDFEFAYTPQIVQRISKGIRRETVQSLFRGDTEIGIATLIKFEYEKHRGLIALSTFVCTPNVFVARGGVAPNIRRAFQQTLLQSTRQTEEHARQRVGRLRRPDEVFLGARPVSPDFIPKFQEILDKAAKFDGS